MARPPSEVARSALELLKSLPVDCYKTADLNDLKPLRWVRAAVKQKRLKMYGATELWDREFVINYLPAPKIVVVTRTR